MCFGCAHRYELEEGTIPSHITYEEYLDKYFLVKEEFRPKNDKPLAVKNMEEAKRIKEKYIKDIRELRLKDGHQLYESYPFAYIDEDESIKRLTDNEKLSQIVRLLHCVKDNTFGGLIHEDDFFNISLFLSKKYHVMK